MSFPILLSPKNDLSLRPIEFLDTEMYRASREIRKMQRLQKKVLTTWIENKQDVKDLPYPNNGCKPKTELILENR